MKQRKLRSDISKFSMTQFGDSLVHVEVVEEAGFFYRTLSFPRTISHRELIATLKNEIKAFLKKRDIKRDDHVFVVGIGNDSHTADSIGPKSLKFLHVNSHLLNLGLDIDNYIVSSLEPGVLGETGIDTFKIIQSVVDEIRPNCLILIDSFVTDSVDMIGTTILLTDEGLTPGSGIKGNNATICEKTLGIPILTVGIPTAVEIFLKTKKGEEKSYLLSPADIDIFVKEISEIIGQSIDLALTTDRKN